MPEDASPAWGTATLSDPFVRVERVSKRFGPVTAVDGVSLDVGRGEIFSILGGSGCGKTTLLRMLAGFEEPSEGRIWIDGQDMTDVPPFERPVHMMFQSYALFPHMSVDANVGYGLKHEAMTRSQRGDRVAAMLALVQLEGLGGRKPHQISGGQRQRVALARALARQPKLLLLDEPLAALDRKLREQTQFELMRIQEATGVTFVVVTHDQEEAMTLSSRMAVMERGRVRQVGTATEVYEFPRNRFVAGFIGSINLFEGRVLTVADGEARVDLADWGGEAVAVAVPGLAPGQAVALAVRPEKVRIARAAPEGSPERLNVAGGRVEGLAYFGKDSLYRVRLPTGRVVSVSAPNARRAGEEERVADWEDDVHLSFAPSAAILLAD